jgi:hypothetical protein
MSTSARREGEGRMVEVRLSQVPQELRRQVADIVIEKTGLAGVQALEVQLRAFTPRQDPSIFVPAEKAELVLAGRLPTGGWHGKWTEGLW